MAAIDVAGYVADLKDHSVDHGFHVHDERHFVETYSLRPGLGGRPSIPRRGAAARSICISPSTWIPAVLLSFEDAVVLLAEDEEPADDFHFPLTFTWALPPLPSSPDLLRLAIDLAGVGGIELPLEGLSHRFLRQRDGRLGTASRASSRGILCRWPGSSAARSCCATCSTAPWPSAGSSSSPPSAGWADVSNGRRRAAPRVLLFAALVAGAVASERV